MAYITGVTANSTSLLTVLQNFAIDNGFTVTGDVIHKGDIFAKVTSPSTTVLRSQGALDVSFTVGVASYTRQIDIDAAYWPVTYHLFYNSNPDMLVLVCQFNVNWCQTMVIGKLVKVNDTIYTGGQIVWASRSSLAELESFISISDSEFFTLGATSANPSVIPWFTAMTSSRLMAGVYTSIDSIGWTSSSITGGSHVYPKIGISASCVKQLYRSPNTWNNQTILVPIHLYASMGNGYLGYLGYVEHFRYVRLDNYNIGDIIEITPTERWKVFSFKFKDTVNRNGLTTGVFTSNYYSSTLTVGTLGFAIRYDGP